MTGSYLAAVPVWPGDPGAARLDAAQRELAGAQGVSRWTTRAMWERYEAGLSLAQVAAEFGVTRQSVYDRLRRRGFALRARRVLPTVEWRGVKYSPTKGGYYRAQAPGRELLHRAVWRAAFGEIPPGHEVHHRAGSSPATTDVADLELVDRRDRSRLRVAVSHLPCEGCGGEVARHPGEGAADYARRRCCCYRCSRLLLARRRMVASGGTS